MNQNEPFVNSELLALVRQARETEIDAVLNVVDGKDEEDARHLSELFRVASNYDDDEMMVCVAAILQKKSSIIFQVLEAERQSLKKGKTNE